MRALGARKKSEFCSSFLGRRVSVLVEEKVDGASGFRRGFSRNYLPVTLPAGADSPNREVDVELNGMAQRMADAESTVDRDADRSRGTRRFSRVGPD